MYNWNYKYSKNMAFRIDMMDYLFFIYLTLLEIPQQIDPFVLRGSI